MHILKPEFDKAPALSSGRPGVQPLPTFSCPLTSPSLLVTDPPVPQKAGTGQAWQDEAGEVGYFGGFMKAFQKAHGKKNEN